MIENTKHSVSSATNIYIHTKITATPIKQQQKNPAGIKILLCYHFSHSAPQYSMRRLNPKNSKESMADEKRATTRTHITTKPFKLHSKQPKKRTNLIPTIYIYIYRSRNIQPSNFIPSPIPALELIQDGTGLEIMKTLRYRNV